MQRYLQSVGVTYAKLSANTRTIFKKFNPNLYSFDFCRKKNVFSIRFFFRHVFFFRQKLHFENHCFFSVFTRVLTIRTRFCKRFIKKSPIQTVFGAILVAPMGGHKRVRKFRVENRWKIRLNWWFLSSYHQNRWSLGESYLKTLRNQWF